MSKFIYRMQNILDIKVKLEEAAKQRYMQAQQALDEQEEILRQLQERRMYYEQEAHGLRKANLCIRDLRENKNALLQMDGYIRAQKAKVNAASERLERERIALQEVMQDRKIHEKLREKAFEDFMQKERSEESKVIDELTTYIHSTKKDDG